MVEDEQQVRAKAAYGKAVLRNLSQELTGKFSAGFDERNPNNTWAFYCAFSIWNAVRTELNWTNYRTLSWIED